MSGLHVGSSPAGLDEGTRRWPRALAVTIGASFRAFSNRNKVRSVCVSPIYCCGIWSNLLIFHVTSPIQGKPDAGWGCGTWSAALHVCCV